jgi:large subunit ribosomal protein L2
MKKYNPTSPSRRSMTGIEHRKVHTTSTPHKRLTKGRKAAAGRNHHGRITTRHQGGGNKKRFRDVDFIFNKRGIPARVETIEYDPYRSARIGLICYTDGERRYIVLPQSVMVGDSIIVAENAPITPGNRLMLKNVPIGTYVYNVELKRDGGAKIARSAGNYAEVIAHDAGFVHLKMPSSEVRKVMDSAWASVGEVSNQEHRLVTIGKAGRSRWLGRRPTVRGAAMNPVDHPHGGGEGRMGRGHRRQRTKWGKPAGKGQKTRTPKKYSNVFIVTRRKKSKRK